MLLFSVAGMGRWLAEAMGVRVEVVRERAPDAPGALAVVAAQPRAPQPVAALEVADATLGAGAVAVQAPTRPGRVGLADAGDVDRLRLLLAVGERVVGRAAAEPAVERDLLELEAQRVGVLERVGQQLVLAGVAGRGRGWQQVAAGAGRVLGDRAQLMHVPELGLLGELALADRARVGVVQRDEPVADALCCQSLADLLADALAAADQHQQRLGAGLLSLAAGPQESGQPACLADRLGQQIPAFGRDLLDFGLRLLVATLERAPEPAQAALDAANA